MLLFAGVNSINEAIHFGVPLICIPMFGDQPSNASMIEQRRLGLYLHIVNPRTNQKITAADIRSALEEILGDHRCRKFEFVNL